MQDIIVLLKESRKDINDFEVIRIFIIYAISTLRFKNEEKEELNNIAGGDVMVSYLKEILEQETKKAIEKGFYQGKIYDKQQMLIKQLNLKFGLSMKEENIIKSCFDPEKLDRAIEKFVYAKDKREVIDLFE